jgi:hypothetical protein
MYVTGGFTTEFLSDRFAPNPSIKYTVANEQYIPISYIAEFSIWLILPLFLVAVLVARRKIFHPT